MIGADLASAPAWLSPLGEIGPAAHGQPLEIVVSCRTSAHGRGRRHPVLLNPDWSLTTPHDLEAERVAQAFGGYLTCLLLADRVVPAVRQRTQLLARRRLPDLVTHSTERWQVAGCSCPPSNPFRIADEAARHQRELAHWAFVVREFPVSQLTRLAETVEAAHDRRTWMPPHRRHRARDLVREPYGLTELWRAGVPPEFVMEVHDSLGATDPLPVQLYLAMAYQRPSYAWVRDVLDVTGNADLAAWCAWTETDDDRTDPEHRLQWLRLGVPWQDVAVLAVSDCTMAEVEDAAAVWGYTPRRAAAVLAGWLRVDCKPAPQQLAAAWRLGGNEHLTPSQESLNALTLRTAGLRPRPTRTELGLALVAAGSVPGAVDHLLDRRTTHQEGSHIAS